jgi:hypothetical protein
VTDKHDIRPTATQPRPNISTEHQDEGDARRPSDTLDRKPKRDPKSGAPIPSDHNPETMTRVGEEDDFPRPEYARPGSDNA